MNRMFNWIRCWFGYSQLSLSIMQLQKQLREMHKEKLRSDELLGKSERAFDRLQKWTEQEVERSQGALRNAREVNQRLEDLMKTQQMHIKNLEEVVIPGLVAANDTFVRRWQAESAVHVMRQTIRSVKESEVT